MRITPIHLHKNKLIQQYRVHDEAIMRYFDYKPFASLKRRLEDIQEMTYNRVQLVQVLKDYNKQWHAPEATLKNINRLKKDNAVVVIGGQQAGLFTGPLYTLNKIISIIVFAKQQEALLDVPVIPVFWIAGEDHDYDEINHIHTVKKATLNKHTIKQALYLRQPLSDVAIDKDRATEWINEAFQTMPETKYTKSIAHRLFECLKQSTSYVDFFTQLIFELFPNEGIVLIDSGHREVRQLEKTMFKQIIHKQHELAKTIYETTQSLQQQGYDINMDVAIDDAHLFYHDEQNERILLKRQASNWVGKNEEALLSTDELVSLIETSPERLSNNVVTRPVMQEFLFPTLAFMAGDGEINYWATLKGAFHLFDMNMPPVIPRLSFTYITDRMNKLLQARHLEVDDVIKDGVNDVKLKWLMSQSSPPIEEVTEEILSSVSDLHNPLREIAQVIGEDMEHIANKNLENIKQSILFLERRLIASLKYKYNFELDQFNELNVSLHPKGGLQERVWNPLPFINEYGTDFIAKITSNQFDFKNNHYIIHIK